MCRHVGAGGGLEAATAHIDKDEDSLDVIYDTNRIGNSFHYTLGPSDGLVSFLLSLNLPSCSRMDW